MITTLIATLQAATMIVATIMDIALVTMILITMIPTIHHAITIMMIIMIPAALLWGPL